MQTSVSETSRGGYSHVLAKEESSSSQKDDIARSGNIITQVLSRMYLVGAIYGRTQRLNPLVRDPFGTTLFQKFPLERRLVNLNYFFLRKLLTYSVTVIFISPGVMYFGGSHCTRRGLAGIKINLFYARSNKPLRLYVQLFLIKTQ